MPLPGERVALHIFEPRYQVLFAKLEANELEEFGIVCTAQGQGATAPFWGGIMRLVFANPPDSHGHRNAVLQCISLFQVDHIQDLRPPTPETFPTGMIRRVQDWKNWRVGPETQHEIQRFDEAMNESLAATNPLVTEAMLHYSLQPTERLNILAQAESDRRDYLFSQTLKFKRLISEQEALKNRGYFPN